MKQLATLILLLVAMTAHPQTKYEFKLKDHWPSATCISIAGACEAGMDYLQFHYSMPNQFWNPAYSWVNKYRNHNPEEGKTFRGKYMVYTTDGWHLLKAARNIFTSGAIAFKIGEKKKWYYIAAEMFGYWLINRASFTIVYNSLKIK